MSKFKKIKKEVRKKINPKILDKYDLLKIDMKKKFTVAWLFLLGGLLIFQGIVRYLPELVNIPEYISFFFAGVIVLIIAIIYMFKIRK